VVAVEGLALGPSPLPTEPLARTADPEGPSLGPFAPSDLDPTTVTYLGHATLLIESGGETIVTDPVFGDRIGRFFTKRRSALALRPEDLRGVSGVLISHAHHDHLDYPSLRRLGRHLTIVVPWGMAVPLRWRGFAAVRTVRPWEEVLLGRWRITAVPSRHFGGRLPWLYSSGHVGYVLTGPRCIYFAGDTGLDVALFREIGRRFDLDLAILPIAGAVFPWFRRNHMNAMDALHALRALRADRMLPMHYGTFPVSFEAAEEPERRLQEETQRASLTERVVVVPPGGSLQLPSRDRSPGAGSPLPPDPGPAALDELEATGRAR
jgi:L-ascorbate metabolism protein UlaG (beta-lactamase superfamily)